MTVMDLGEAALFNPRIKLAKGSVAPYIAMETVQPFTRDVFKTENKGYRGGVKFVDGDILMARITPCLENGKTSIYRAQAEDQEIAFGSTEFIVVRGIPGKSLTNYLYYLLTSPEIRDVAIASMTGSSGRQRVQNDVLMSYQVDLPSVNTQQAIAATLGALDDKIESNRHLVTVSNAFLKCEFDKICQESTPVYFNFDQAIKRLQVKHKHSGKTVSLTGRTPVFDQSISGILGYVSTDPEFDASASDPIILFGDHTCSLRLLKQAADVGPNVIPMISTEFKGISTVWIYFALLGKQKMQEYRRHWMEFREKEITWVDEVAQRNFLSIATPILEKTISAEKENKYLQSLRDALLPELMSGRIRVPEAQEAIEDATNNQSDFDKSAAKALEARG